MGDRNGERIALVDGNFEVKAIWKGAFSKGISKIAASATVVAMAGGDLTDNGRESTVIKVKLEG